MSLHATAPPDEKPRPLLLVDDDPGVREVLGGQLELEGYVVASCADAAHALELLRDQCFPVIISDQQMPGLTGLEFLMRARALQPHAARILITGLLASPTLVKAINEGEIFRFVAKPWNRADLVATVKTAISRHDRLASEEQIRAEASRLNQELSLQIAQIRGEYERLAAAHQALAGELEHSLELCQHLLAWHGPLFTPRTRRVVEICRRMVELPDAPFSPGEKQILLAAAWLHGADADEGETAQVSLPQTTAAGGEFGPRTQLPQLAPLSQLSPLVNPSTALGKTVQAAREHRGEEIPWTARCLAVAVAFASLPAGTLGTATLSAETGGAFDPDAVRLLLRAESARQN